jgi:flagellar hook assembly protein FlgD
MKTMFKKIILGATLLIVSSSIAVASEAKIRTNGNKTFVLNLTDLSENVEITLKNKNGQVLFEDVIQGKNEYSKKFDLELLKAGTYFITIEDATKIKTLPLELSQEQLVYDETSLVERYKPHVMQKGSLLFVNYFSPEKSNLDICIYNSRGELVYNETLKGDIRLGKSYDFSKSPKGEYTIDLMSDGKYYSHEISVIE